MAGSPDNVNIWADADVWMIPANAVTGSGIAALVPGTPDFTDAAALALGWRLIGLLDGDKGFEEAAEWDETEHKAWGYGVIKVSYKDFKMTRKFTSLEDNPNTAYLISKNDDGQYVRVSKPADAYLMFRTQEADGGYQTRITCAPASVSSKGRNQNEKELASVEFEAKILPDSQKRLFIKLDTPTEPTARNYKLTIDAGVTGGTFKLDVDGDDTTPIDFDATSAELTAALTAAGATAVNATGTGPITFTASSVQAITAADNSLVGGGFTLALV